MYKKTFKEVIADIKPGEVWQSKRNRLSEIYLSESGYTIFKVDDFSLSSNRRVCVDGNDYYELKRNKYTFTEAFKAYEEGKEIESVVTKDRYIKIDGEDMYYSELNKDFINGCDCFEMKEIRGEWFVDE